jgi:DUF1707 SHOCT-like domain
LIASINASIGCPHGRADLFERLNRHAAAGTLTLAELERRVEVVATAQTREEALSAVADLSPFAGEVSPPAARPRWGRGHGKAEARADWRPTDERFQTPAATA